MLQHFGNAFFIINAIDRKGDKIPPTIHISIYNRESREIIGALRFNYDPNYAKELNHIRMSFDVFNLKDIDPMFSTMLEDIIIGGFAWITMDNHYIYNFKPVPYMTIHSYKEDNLAMNSINVKSKYILETDIGCVPQFNDTMFIFNKDTSKQLLSQKLLQKN